MSEEKINIERSVLLLKSKKNTLVTRKIKLQEELGNLRDKRDYEICSNELNTIYIDRKVLKNELHNLEIEIKDINLSIKKKNILANEVTIIENASVKQHPIVNEIESLRSKYREFSKDYTRINSMRIMATEFEQSLEKIIKKHK